MKPYYTCFKYEVGDILDNGIDGTLCIIGRTYVECIGGVLLQYSCRFSDRNITIFGKNELGCETNANKLIYSSFDFEIGEVVQSVVKKHIKLHILERIIKETKDNVQLFYNCRDFEINSFNIKPIEFSEIELQKLGQ